MLNYNPPYLGVAYYPEDWPDEELERDVARMQSLGIRVARIAEFAWHRMEPRDGAFDFSYFERVIDRLTAANIAVILGTPTATPPIWFVRKFPDALAEGENGRKMSHGGRRHCCSNNPHYNEYSLRIVEAMAKKFGSHPNVIGWQIDNEIYAFGGGCFCPECVARFRDYLREKYHTIDALNEAWNLNLFSQWYDDFSEIPAPRDGWHNPHLICAWKTFQQHSHVAFVHRQAEILHRYTKAPVGTDTMPFGGMNYRELTEKLDVVQFNHYNTPQDLYCCAFWFDYLRTLKERPFWNTETATNWNGSAAISQSIKPDGYCRANSWLPIALGGEANLYWLWRTHWAGHELLHGAVIDTTGKDMLTTGEVKQVADAYARCADFINATKVKTEIAMHFTAAGWNMHESQPVVSDWAYAGTLQGRFYRPMLRMGLRPDVIDAGHDLNGYKLIFTPMLMSLEEENLSSRMSEWVHNGGTWVVGPLTDVRNADGARYRDRFYGVLESLTGIAFRYFAPDREHRIEAAWSDGHKFGGDTWFEMVDPNGGESLAKAVKGHSAVEGLSIFTRVQVGKGSVLLLGTVPTEETMQEILQIACAQSGIQVPETEGEIAVSKREGANESGLMLVETGGKSAKFKLDRKMRDLISDADVSGTIELQPYAVYVLKEA